MSSSLPPKIGSQTNKWVVFLLVGGAVILIAAVAIMFLKKGDSSPPPPSEPAKSAFLQAPAPLVISERTRPLAARKLDAGVEQAIVKKAGGKKRETPVNKGSIDTKEVNRYMNEHFGEVKACYEHRLKTNSFLEGELDLNIEINLNGKVAGISANKNTIRDSEMISCVKRVIRKWQFPKPTGGAVTVAKRFTFKKSAS